MREFKAVVLGGEHPSLARHECTGSLYHNMSGTRAVAAGGVGKSALVVRFILDQFVELYDPTIDGAYQTAL